MLGAVLVASLLGAPGESPDGGVGGGVDGGVDGGVGGRLTLEPGNGCLDRERLVGLVERWLGDADVSAMTVAVQPGEGGSLSIRIHRGDQLVHERAFPELPGDCADTHALVALSIAIGMDADAMPEAEPAASPPAAESPADAAATSRAVAPPVDEPPPPARFRPAWLLAVGAWSSTVVFPTPSYGGHVDVRLEAGERVDLSLGFVTAFAPKWNLGGGGATGLLLGGQAGVCAGTKRQRASLRGCAQAVAGAVRIAGSGFDEDLVNTRAYAGASAGLRWTMWPAPRVGIGAQVGAMVPFTRLRVREIGPGGAEVAAQRTPPVGLGVAVGGVFSLSRPPG